jgi:NAD(P)H-dependent FMN reductase
MSAIKNVLLLVGSPKGANSVSDAIGSYLLERITASGVEGKKIFIQPALKADPTGQELADAFEKADIILLVFPLYIDSLPHPVIEALEILAAAAPGKSMERKGLVAVCNSGFPEVRHNDLALAMCRQFAKEAGLTWKGGLALGGGGATAGKDLRKGGGRVRHIKKAIEIAADALVENKPIPQEAVSLMAGPITPTWLYLFMGNLGWRIQACRNGVRSRLRDRPYSRQE